MPEKMAETSLSAAVRDLSGESRLMTKIAIRGWVATIRQCKKLVIEK